MTIEKDLRKMAQKKLHDKERIMRPIRRTVNFLGLVTLPIWILPLVIAELIRRKENRWPAGDSFFWENL